MYLGQVTWMYFGLGYIGLGSNFPQAGLPTSCLIHHVGLPVPVLDPECSAGEISCTNYSKDDCHANYHCGCAPHVQIGNLHGTPRDIFIQCKLYYLKHYFKITIIFVNQEKFHNILMSIIFTGNCLKWY